MPSSPDDHHGTPPKTGPRGFLPLYEESSALSVNGGGRLNLLIKSQSSSSLHGLHRVTSHRARELSVEENLVSLGESDAHSQHEERRLSILNGPLMRSQRLIGNSNPR